VIVTITLDPKYADVPSYLATRDQHTSGCRYSLRHGGRYVCKCKK